MEHCGCTSALCCCFLSERVPSIAQFPQLSMRVCSIHSQVARSVPLHVMMAGPSLQWGHEVWGRLAVITCNLHDNASTTP